MPRDAVQLGHKVAELAPKGDRGPPRKKKESPRDFPNAECNAPKRSKRPDKKRLPRPRDHARLLDGESIAHFGDRRKKQTRECRAIKSVQVGVWKTAFLKPQAWATRIRPLKRDCQVHYFSPKSEKRQECGAKTIRL